MARIFRLCCFLVSMGATSVWAQTPIPKDSVRITAALLDTIKPTFKPTIIPRKATIRSAIVPGLGQIYMKQWWTLPFIYGGFATMGVFINYNQTRYRILLNAYRELIPLEYNPDGSVKNALATVPVTISGQTVNMTDAVLILNKNFYRRNRDLSIIGVLGIWGLNVLEANVAAHMKTFDDSDSISWRVTPGVQSEYGQIPLGATLTVRFSSNPEKAMTE